MIGTQAGRVPADFADVRATNLAVVLGYVRANAPCSRADIAGNTGLNKATVSSLVGELIERRLLRETGLTERRIGRPATMLVLDGAPYAAVGLSVAVDHLTVVAADLAGERLLSWRRAPAGGTAANSGGPTRGTTARDTAANGGTAGTGGDGAAPAGGVPAGRSAAAIAALARRALGRLREQGRTVLGLTVGVAGLVDGNGVVRNAPNLGWRDVPLRDTLAAALGDPAYPVRVENDATLAALAEHRYGAHAGVPDLAHLTGEDGIGAGLVCGGRPLRGSAGYAGEIGHVPVLPDGPVCGCGRRGCLEAVAGIGALARRLGCADGDPEVAMEELPRRARAQEPAVLAALREAGTHLGYGASLLANLVNPEVVILGGYYVPLAPWLLPAAQQELDARAVAPGGTTLVTSALGHEAAALGGAAAVLDAVDAGDLPAPTAA